MTLIFFGMSSPDGSAVSEAEWQAFAAEFITPRFPEGFTVFDAMGQYRSASAGARDAVTREAAKVLLLVHDGDEAAQRKVEEIAAEYRVRFRQEAVLRATADVGVAQ